MLHRAYSVIHLRSVADEGRDTTIRGLATTPTADRYGDIVEPEGAHFAPELPLLWQHNAKAPVGVARLGRPSRAGIPFDATLPNVREPGALKTRIDEAIHSLKYRLVGAVSIGFRPLKDGIEALAGGAARFIDYEILELSLVTIPANADATIDVVRSLDPTRYQAARPAWRPSSARSRGAVKLNRGAVKLIRAR